MGKRRKDAPDGEARKGKQPTLQACFATSLQQQAEAGADAIAQLPIVVEQEEQTPLLDLHLAQELQHKADGYLQTWGDKCENAASSASGRQGAGRALEGVDLDSAGMRFLEALHHLLPQALSRGAAFDK